MVYNQNAGDIGALLELLGIIIILIIILLKRNLNEIY